MNIMYKLRVKEILKTQGRTGRDLATELGMTEVGLYKAIGENGNPSLKRLQDIADSLNVEVWELFTERPEESEISGFIKAKGVIYEIKSLQDIENLLDILRL
ncbi:helix-turn-helix transcriptional regulator [uncultured Parabacteroides sp.]|uniref:helix-turn-helix domain-containing protein n=1 Tax=uncultured Parabacteroides sp. TaxID=512312 RepID=UPI00262EB1CE|nr:helix-turn-helix transcriptional regulator [uncultured Parabacteroides sp.]